jgi:hypothetical protein
MECPKCGGEMWDNRTKKTNPKAPDYRCKDKECEGRIWPPKEQKKPKPDKTPIGAKIETAQFATDSQLQLLLSVLRQIEINTRPRTGAIGKTVTFSGGITGDRVMNTKFDEVAEEAEGWEK